jgi:hypothetical protein
MHLTNKKRPLEVCALGGNRTPISPLGRDSSNPLSYEGKYLILRFKIYEYESDLFL